MVRCYLKSFDIERVQEIDFVEKQDYEFIKNEIEKLKGQIEYIPPKFSAKRVNGLKAYECSKRRNRF